nr:microbial terpene synthase-like protein 4 [Dryopteris fragrans]
MASDGVEVVIGEEFMSEVSSITIPPVQCSFPWNIHPDSERLKHLSDAWIRDRLPHAFSAELGKAGYELLTTLLHANAQPNRMEPVVKIMAWFFLVDTVMDDPALLGADVTAADALITSICAVLEEPATYTYSGENELVRATVDTATEWWHEMRQGMPASQRTRFIAQFKRYLEGNRRQIPYRTSRSLPNLDTYCRNRDAAGGWQLCSVLLEYSLAICFDEETLSHPLIRSLQSATAYNIYWQNDLCSFKKEFLENDLLNVVPILYVHKQQKSGGDVTLESVVQEVCTMIKERDEECVRLVAEIKASELLMGKPGMAGYLEGVGNWLGGHMYWQLVTPRYGVCASTDMHHQPPDFSAHYHLSLRRPELLS